MIAQAVRVLYSALMWLGQPLLRLKLARRSRLEPGYGQAVAERFGHYQQPAGSGSVWLHAVSLGETRAAAALVEQLRARRPGMRLLVTNGTATGRAESARLLLQEGDIQVWQPWDTPGAVDRFLHHFRPAVGILMETEMWPNLCAACCGTDTPLVLANARFSDQSLRRTKLLAWLARPAYQSLAAVWAQTEADAQRLRKVGAPVQAVYGNLKFDLQPDPQQLARAADWRAGSRLPVVMFASSREGEEVMLLEVLAKKKPKAQMQPSSTATNFEANPVQWLIVPRHPQRFDAVAESIRAQGFGLSRRSQWNPCGPPASTQPVVWLGDSLGEMPLYFGLSDVALLGGSFAPLGGQNLIEAAACGCPVVLGPHTFNFEQAALLAMEAGAALRVPDMEAAVAAAVRLATNATLQRDMASHAKTFVNAHGDASRRTADAIDRVIAAAEAGLTRSNASHE